MSFQSDELPCPATTRAILIGAGQFPHFRAYARSTHQNAAFVESARSFQRYLRAQMSLHETDVLDLIDSVASPSQQLQQIREFLRQQSPKVPQPRNLIVYFVGHGTMVDGRYHLIIRASDDTLPKTSTIETVELVRLLAREAQSLRCCLLLDACFAGRAQEALHEVHWPKRSSTGELQGLVIVAAAGAQLEAQTPPESAVTMFMGGLLESLAAGGGAQSIDGVVQTTVRLIRARYGDAAVVPQVLDDDPDGALGSLPLFATAPANSVPQLRPGVKAWRWLRSRARRVRVAPVVAMVAALLLLAGYFNRGPIRCFLFPPPPASQHPNAVPYFPSADELQVPAERDIRPQDVTFTIVNATRRRIKVLMVSCEASRRQHAEPVDPFQPGSLAAATAIEIDTEQPFVKNDFQYGAGWYVFFVYDPCAGWLPYCNNGRDVGAFNLFQARTTLLTIAPSSDAKFPYLWTFSPGVSYVAEAH